MEIMGKKALEDNVDFVIGDIVHFILRKDCYFKKKLAVEGICRDEVVSCEKEIEEIEGVAIGVYADSIFIKNPVFYFAKNSHNGIYQGETNGNKQVEIPNSGEFPSEKFEVKRVTYDFAFVKEAGKRESK